MLSLSLTSLWTPKESTKACKRSSSDEHSTSLSPVHSPISIRYSETLNSKRHRQIHPIRRKRRPPNSCIEVVDPSDISERHRSIDDPKQSPLLGGRGSAVSFVVVSDCLWVFSFPSFENTAASWRLGSWWMRTSWTSTCSFRPVEVWNSLLVRKSRSAVCGNQNPVSWRHGLVLEFFLVTLFALISELLLGFETGAFQLCCCRKVMMMRKINFGFGSGAQKIGLLGGHLLWDETLSYFKPKEKQKPWSCGFRLKFCTVFVSQGWFGEKSGDWAMWQTAELARRMHSIFAFIVWRSFEIETTFWLPGALVSSSFSPSSAPIAKSETEDQRFPRFQRLATFDWSTSLWTWRPLPAFDAGEVCDRSTASLTFLIPRLRWRSC